MKPRLHTGLLLFALLLSSCVHNRDKPAELNPLLTPQLECKDTFIAQDMTVVYIGHLFDDVHCNSVGVLQFSEHEGILFYGDNKQPAVTEMIDSVVTGPSMDILFKDLNNDGLKDIIVWSFYNKVTYSVYLHRGIRFKKLELSFPYKEISQFKNSNYAYSYNSNNDAVESRLFKIDTSSIIIDSLKIPLQTKSHTFKDSRGKTFDTDVAGVAEEFVAKYWAGRLGMASDSGASSKPWSEK
jgi:hypothetical protein